MLNYSILVKIQ